MAGRYSRTYSRKKSTNTPPISQFDRLISEHGKSTHPVASKTAGHIGKWGITSFTSLRSISENFGKEEIGKRNWLDSPPSSGAADGLFSGVAVSDASKNVSLPKRRKFFKRDFNSISNSTLSPSSSSTTNCENVSEPQNVPLSQIPTREEFNVPKYPASVNDSYKSVDISNVKSQKSNSGITVNKSGGGIKLKIFKSRNSDVNALETYSSSVQLPSDDSGSLSNSSSVANSPKSDSLSQPEHKCALSPNGLVVTEPPLATDCDLDPVESMKENLQSDNLSYKSDFKSNLSFHEINEKLQSSPLMTNRSMEMAENIAETQPQESSLLSYGLDTYDSIQEETLEKESPHLPDNEQNGSLNLVGDYSQKENESSSEVCETVKEDSSYADWVSSPKEQNPLTQKQPKDQDPDVDLFGTDFDENEIADRTSIEYSSGSANYDFGETLLARSNTIDLGEVDTPQSSVSSLSSTRSSSYRTISHTEDFEGKSSALTKKRSIFKSRQKEGDPKKRATYRHKWHGHEDKDENFRKENIGPKLGSGAEISNEDPFSFDITPVLKRVQTWPSSSSQPNLDDSLEEPLTSITSLKCPKPAKKYYTVIKNVKKTHQLQESGEFQEFNDDVDYFLDALRSSNSVSTRCLASLNLAQKCMTPAFRMHLRAHATVIKFFRALSDAPSHPHLAECAAMVMFALSQDRLNMDLDRGSLELMLNLLDTDMTATDNSNQLSDVAASDLGSKICRLCKELQEKGHAKHLKLESINAASLAMETLLSLTSKRAGEWFKEELRDLGGVDHLLRTVTSSAASFSQGSQNWSPPLLEKLSRIDRCLKVLENVTHQNETNQEYLLSVNDGGFSDTLMRLFRMCRVEVPLHPQRPQDALTLTTHNPAAAKGIITTLITTFKVLINLTHGARKEAVGSKILGKDDEIYDISIYCLLMMPLYLDHDTKFEIQVLACCLMLNLVENSPDNRKRLMNLSSPIIGDDDEIFKHKEREDAMSSLVTLFYTSEESARIQEAHTDHIIDTDLTQESKEEEKKDEEIEETVARLLQKAGRHMEDTLIAAYTALLAGYCIMDNKEFEERIRYMQPEGHFKTMVAVLKKFLHFMKMTATETAKMPRECKNSPDSFCYICGSVPLRQYKRQLTQHVKKLYELYFGCKVGDQDKRWAPHICCQVYKFTFCLGERQRAWPYVWRTNGLEGAKGPFNR